ncbi:unnamed protein product, partial [Adineta steineri]
KDEKIVENSIQDILQILRKLINSTRNLTAITTDQQIQISIIERSRDVLKYSINLIHEAKKVLQTSSDQNKLSLIARDLSSAINSCMSNMPSQRYFDEVIKQMCEYVYALAGPFDRKSSPLSLNSDSINRAAANLNQATTDLVVSTHTGGTNDLAKT